MVRQFQRIGAFAETVPAGSWITGGDWDHEMWGGVLPDRSWIDEVTPDNPVFVTRLDWHMALANTRALEIAGVSPDVRSPDGGEVVRDKTGRLTGVFKDEAMPLVGAHIPRPTEAQRDTALVAAMQHAASLGVTGVTDMGSWADLQTYERAHESGDLTLRVYAFVPLSTVDRLAERVEKAGVGDEWLRIGGLKGFVDGSLGSGTALFEEPYTDEPDNSGLFVTPLDELRRQVSKAEEAGLQLEKARLERFERQLLREPLRVTLDPAPVARRHIERHRRGPAGSEACYNLIPGFAEGHSWNRKAGLR